MNRPDAKRIAFGMATDSKFNRVGDDDRRNEPRAVNQLSAELAGLISSFVKYTLQEAFEELSDMFSRNYKEVGLESYMWKPPTTFIIGTRPIHGETFSCDIYGPNSRYRRIAVVWSEYDVEEFPGEMNLTEIRNVFSVVVHKLLTSLPLPMAIQRIKEHFIKKQIEHPHWVVSKQLASKQGITFKARNVKTNKKIQMTYDQITPQLFNPSFHVVSIDGYGPRRWKGHFCEADVVKIIEELEIGIEIDTMRMFKESQLVKWIEEQFSGWGISEDFEDPNRLYVHCDYYKSPYSMDGSIGTIEIKPEFISISVRFVFRSCSIYLPGEMDSIAKPYFVDVHNQLRYRYTDLEDA